MKKPGPLTGISLTHLCSLPLGLQNQSAKKKKTPAEKFPKRMGRAPKIAGPNTQCFLSKGKKFFDTMLKGTPEAAGHENKEKSIGMILERGAKMRQGLLLGFPNKRTGRDNLPECAAKRALAHPLTQLCLLFSGRAVAARGQFRKDVCEMLVILLSGR
jgi:hypothetical protein